MEQIGSLTVVYRAVSEIVNSDGTPEVLTHSCFNGESESDTYWSLTPNASQVEAINMLSPNPALNLAPFSRWTLRDKTAQRRLALR